VDDEVGKNRSDKITQLVEKTANVKEKLVIPIQTGIQERIESYDFRQACPEHDRWRSRNDGKMDQGRFSASKFHNSIEAPCGKLRGIFDPQGSTILF